ncbi:MAG TPA: hypothetical protein QGF70_00460, partial [Candidatus Thalassarchaeaceae archaeon]|nr:hypothetical protein [Candidatus Thalassarchaeaceae archaeon]
MNHTERELLAVDERVLLIQDEVRQFFSWSLEKDLDSAITLSSAIDNSEVEGWSQSRRAQTLANLHRRLVLRPTDVAILGAAITVEEVKKILLSNTLIIAADGAIGVLNELADSDSDRAWSRIACLVSDADGGEGTIAAVKRGVPIILHAHGDNQAAWSSLV